VLKNVGIMVVWEPCACLDKIDFDSVTNRVDKIDRVDCKSTAWLCAVDSVHSTGDRIEVDFVVSVYEALHD